MEWPWRRFEAFYESYLKRAILESLDNRKSSMIAALWANSNYDDDKGSRKRAIEEIEENFAEVVQSIVDPGSQEAEIDPDNPFFNESARSKQKLEAPRNDEGTVSENIASRDLAALDQ
jgi:hypothetical protein